MPEPNTAADTALAELDTYVGGLDGLRLECDGMCNVIGLWFDRAGVPFTAHRGILTEAAAGRRISTHIWIDLLDGRWLDLRARMWLGDQPHVPHGIFKPADFPQVSYEITGPWRTRRDWIVFLALTGHPLP